MRLPLRRARIRKSLRHAWLRLAAFAIGCQFLVPTGYMPGSFANGTPFVLCTMYTGAVAHESAGRVGSALDDTAHSVGTVQSDTVHGDTAHSVGTVQSDTVHGDATHGAAAHGEAMHVAAMLGDATHSEAIHGEAIPGDAMRVEAMHSDATHSEAMHGEATPAHDEHLGAEAWEHCPLGALSAGAALAFAFPPAVAPIQADPILIPSVARPRSIDVLTARARAPPRYATSQLS